MISFDYIYYEQKLHFLFSYCKIVTKSTFNWFYFLYIKSIFDVDLKYFHSFFRIQSHKKKRCRFSELPNSWNPEFLSLVLSLWTVSNLFILFYSIFFIEMNISKYKLIKKKTVCVLKDFLFLLGEGILQKMIFSFLWN